MSGSAVREYIIIGLDFIALIMLATLLFWQWGAKEGGESSIIQQEQLRRPSQYQSIHEQQESIPPPPHLGLNQPSSQQQED